MHTFGMWIKLPVLVEKKTHQKTDSFLLPNSGSIFVYVWIQLQKFEREKESHSHVDKMSVHFEFSLKNFDYIRFDFMLDCRPVGVHSITFRI